MISQEEAEQSNSQVLLPGVRVDISKIVSNSTYINKKNMDYNDKNLLQQGKSL